MDSQPSALTGSAGYSLPPRSEYTTGDVFPLSVCRLHEWLIPSCCAVQLLSVCLAHCQAIVCLSLQLLLCPWQHPYDFSYILHFNSSVFYSTPFFSGFLAWRLNSHFLNQSRRWSKKKSLFIPLNHLSNWCIYLPLKQISCPRSLTQVISIKSKCAWNIFDIKGCEDSCFQLTKSLSMKCLNSSQNHHQKKRQKTIYKARCLPLEGRNNNLLEETMCDLSCRLHWELTSLFHSGWNQK